MRDPASPLTQPVLWLALAGILAVLIVRAVRKDRREYARFKRYRTTLRRQAMLRRWLWDSFTWLGGLAVVSLVLAGAFVAPLLQQLMSWPLVSGIRGIIIHDASLAVGVIVGLVIVFALVTVVGVRAARREQDVPMIGDIAAMLPRNRQELRIGAVIHPERVGRGDHRQFALHELLLDVLLQLGLEATVEAPAVRSRRSHQFGHRL